MSLIGDESREYQRRRRAKAAADATCQRCTAPAAPGYRHCERHRDIERQRGRERRRYQQWLAGKSRVAPSVGFRADELSPALFPHQRDLVAWALRKGRAAIFADTGLGKSLMQLEWARHVSQAGRVLILAPLAVGRQTQAEGERFGIEATYRRADEGDRITIANYEMLSHFDPAKFVGIVLDESSILKAYDGKTRTAIIGAFAATPYRLACTATPAPNDFTELGNHSEFLGIRSRTEMLAEFFIHDGGSTQDWRLKGHAVKPFWEWVASWGAIVRSPADLGHDDKAYRLPPLEIHEHVIAVDHREAWSEGYLFAPQVTTLQDARATRRATMRKRAELAAQLCMGDEPAIVWGELNDECNLVESLIDGAVQVAGSDDLDVKVERLEGFASGRHRAMVTKSKVAGFGMNWQHCARMVFMGASYSYEQTYQSIRRCWRFGQSQPVHVHIIRAETEEHVVDAYRRKAAAAELLANEITERTRDAVRADVLGQGEKRWVEYQAATPLKVPAWLK